MSTNNNNTNKLLANFRELAKGITVLYVEDDPLIRREYLTFLSRFFEKIQSEDNGLSGFRAALKQKFDIIISDIHMPKMDGLEMIEKIKEKYPDQATLLISSHKDSDVLHRSVQLGVDGYIFKPLERNQTIDLLHKIVSKIRLEQENFSYKQHLEKLVFEKTREVIENYTIDRISGLYSLAKLEKDMIESTHHSLALLKINNFKNLNDFYGYEAGNSVLKQVADFLRHSMKNDFLMRHDVLYRVSGTHFALLLPTNATQLAHYVHLIIQKFESTEIQVDDQLMYLEMDAGIVDFDNGLTLSHADSALRQAEKEGNIVIYKKDEHSAQEHHQKLQCKDQIKRALKENRFLPYYQPIVDNESMNIIKYEALARLIMPDGSIIFPASFLPIAKKTKMYNMITKTIIQKALHDFRDSKCTVSINLSIDDIKHIPTREFILVQIALFPNPNRLVFELLESEGIGEYEEVQHFFAELKQFGCSIAIDDFGSGYSNFEHIAKLNVDYIKIDGSLILNIDNAPVSYAIVEMLASFALKMGIKTIAEFVAEESIHTLLTSIGINESQGYLFGKAIPFNDTMQHIQAYNNDIIIR